MSSSRIRRYILLETFIPALLALGVFTFVLLMGRMLRLVEMVVNKGMPLVEIAQLFIFLLPSFLVITLPLSFLLGILLGLGRLSADGEIIALKSSGVGLYGLLKPILFLGLIVSAATALLTLYAEPAGNTAFRSKVFQIATSHAGVSIQPQVFNDDFDGLVLYADDIDERRGVMQGLFISDERTGDVPATIIASRGRLITDASALTMVLRLEEGSIHRRPDQERETYQTIHFSIYDISLDLGARLAATEGRQRKAKELTLAELREARSTAETPTQRNTLTADLHRRFVLPLAPFLFALVGVPLGVQNQRSGKGGGFAIGLVVFLAYYLMFSFAETMAIEGGFPPVPVLWLPTVVFLAGGIHLVRLCALERRIALLDHLTEGIPRALRRLTHLRRKKR